MVQASSSQQISSAFDDGRPTVSDLQGADPLAQAAKKHWANDKNSKFKPNAVKTDIYDVLEKEGFRYRSLLILEQLQFLEKYLWPNFSDEATNFHVICIALMVNVKRRECLLNWDLFSSSPVNFSELFRRVLSMSIDRNIPLTIRTHLIMFIISAYQSLDNPLVRKECATLVSIAIWHNLSSEKARNGQLDKYPHLRKAWRASLKRFEAADEAGRGRLRFERSWLYQVILDFIGLMYRPAKDATEQQQTVNYCERFIELMIDLLSQLPTRRYVNFLLQDLHLTTTVKLSPIYSDPANGLLRDLHSLLHRFMTFSIDDHTAVPLNHEDWHQVHCAVLARLQRVSFKHFKDKLTILALSNYGTIGQREELSTHLGLLEVDELKELCKHLDLRVAYPKGISIPLNAEFYMEVLLSVHEKKKNYQEEAAELTILPNENNLFDESLLRHENYDGSKPLGLPKLGLQYLTVGDFLWRSFILYRCETFFSIRKDLEESLKRLQAKLIYPSLQTSFGGFSKMALVIEKPAIVEVAPPKVGEDKPAYVRAEINIDMSRLPDDVRRDWDALRPDDVVFLLAVRGSDKADGPVSRRMDAPLADQYGLKALRTAEVVQILDKDGRVIRDPGQMRGMNSQMRRIHIKLDPAMYRQDEEHTKAGKPDIYESVNVIVRRRGRENNFKPVLESIQELTQSDVPMPTWLEEVFLGYGDPAGAHYKNIRSRPTELDFRDTFVDWTHLVESFPGKVINPPPGADKSIPPPYILSNVHSAAPEQKMAKATKKQRRETVLEPVPDDSICVRTYKLPNMGPYTMDKPRQNHLKFTPAQVEAIVSGTNPGLTVIVGPPGTGKTDVATQIISNLYHNFPQQRTLLIAHSNQALNQLFQKITALGIDERHLLRLGHGEEDLKSDNNYSKQGRVESFMENRARLLAEVDRLAVCLGAPGAHGDSCETADYFNIVYVKPTWAKFEEFLGSGTRSIQEIKAAYPFNDYFSNAPREMFPDSASPDDALEVAMGGYRHIKKIFSELEDIRPFELLRVARDRQNYLLTKEARVVAMTSTHAAMRRHDIAKLGFTYENIVMEEAAQVTEIETFIPFALQKPTSAGELPLQRIILLGDHYQNSPIIQNLALRQHANLEQSLFARFVRLGVPTVSLDQQGRARPSIAQLYSWRYQNLGNLPLLEQQPEYRTANAGFRHEFQFVDVPDFRGKGEEHPQPHFIQNLGEAEYAVALYQYMRLLGYPREKITVLTTYTGQRALIRDVLHRRCAKNPLFGFPGGGVGTVDKYQGEQNDYVILSLVRTSRPGYLRDMRRMTVALSRARLGLYVLGRRTVFESCYELNEVFSRLIASRRTKLELVVGEMWPTQREAGAESPEGTVVMEDVTHLGQYVYEMTVTAVERLKAGGSIAGVIGAATVETPAQEAEEDLLQECSEGDAEREDEGGIEDGEGGAIAMEL
ncbi:P-loop containing nucleoside triphosphate hydrolase protein [Terfezia boudieri ATCC MYA-4762]|uniref:Pre-mRNA-splicing factor n=1 Tax=Terfezia boudieri ATCC MYA-4762 TaxID=1051890 RepID=A0A3N4M0C1_9PEZI|nr:P-loop containing nucleoside triphosphate hydrolase protein [Terfezia boudieri ATCC MYA-4762]